MADTFTQIHQRIRLATAAGADDLLLASFVGQEGLSQLFSFHLKMMAPMTLDIDFAKVLGQPASLSLDLPDGQGTRSVHGHIVRFSQGHKDEEFIHYEAELVPEAWYLTRRVQSRIFQFLSVPEILKKVLAGLKVGYQIQGQFHPRDYCVQYRESDWDFACRLMEEEGICYYFQHGETETQLVLTNTPGQNPPLPLNDELIYEGADGGFREEGRVHSWVKVQEVISGKLTLWDHCFEVPGNNLEASAEIPDGISVGDVFHKLTVGQAKDLELYDYPGAYAQRFDGIDRGGAPQPDEITKIFADNRRTAVLRLQEEATRSLSITGTSDCVQLTSGHRFALTRHFNADGEYLVDTVKHSAKLDSYRSAGSPIEYSNQFRCLPGEMPYTPPRKTPRPFVRGGHTATVVGPPGEEIFTDKYGRVKVQFHWDRVGQFNAESSCWIRVGSPAAGKSWGMIHIPRIGQEVIVIFLEGDPDQPIVVGSVYNAEQMPPWELPDNKTQSGMFSNSSPGGGGANCLRFEDKKGKEQVYLVAQKNQDIEVKNDETHSVGNDRTKTIEHNETVTVKNDRTETVNNNETIMIGGNRTETVSKNETLTVAQSQSLSVGMNQTTTIAIAHMFTVGAAQTISVGAAQALTVGAVQTISVGGAQMVDIGMSQSISVGSNITESVGGNFTQTVGKDHTTKVSGNRSSTVEKDESLKVTKKMVVEVGEEILFKTGSASLLLKKDGTISLKGKDILLDGSGKITVKAASDLKLKGSKIGEN